MSDQPPAANDDPTIIRLAALRLSHKDLDDSIVALLAAGPASDQLQIARLKRQKLALRDQIAAMEDSLTPDIIA
jgi:hypothetical protein